LRKLKKILGFCFIKTCPYSLAHHMYNSSFFLCLIIYQTTFNTRPPSTKPEATTGSAGFLFLQRGSWFTTLSHPSQGHESTSQSMRCHRCGARKVVGQSWTWHNFWAGAERFAFAFGFGMGFVDDLVWVWVDWLGCAGLSWLGLVSLECPKACLLAFFKTCNFLLLVFVDDLLRYTIMLSHIHI
jgi:hypothetical protein